jgi:hypothetical protein
MNEMNNTNERKIDLKFAVITGLILLAAFSRIVPHIYNFSPLGAIGMFGAAWFTKKWQALVIPLAATFISDLFINNVIYAQYNLTFTWFYEGAYWQYITYIFIITAGLLIFKNKVTAPKVLAGAVASSAIFFLMSNFGSWIVMSIYPKNFTGLMASYTAGIPFIGGTILGDLFYSAVMFGSYALISKKVPALRFAS